MANFELVVGAGYGDEGKGTTVARIAKAHKFESVLNVLTNGGSQRGHSVLFNGKTHIFKHFGAGTFSGAVTCFSNDFILNPIQFCKEYNELESNFCVRPESLRMEKCKWSTPYDMMYNQMDSMRYWENTFKWKGTCGMGIWATLQRYNEMPNTPDFSIFMLMPEDKQMQMLDSIKAYYEKKIDVSKYSQYASSWNSLELKLHFLSDCRMMFEKTGIFTPNYSYLFSTIIFENGQGLLLGDTGIDDPEKTPSITGSKSIAELKLSDFSDDNENAMMVHYVTRPYLTRHGSETFISENVDGDIDPGVETNSFNIWQRGFRYGNLNILSLKREIEKDSSWTKNFKNWEYCLDVTHCDELDRIEEFKSVFGNGLRGVGGKTIALNFHDSPKVTD